ncbi:MAG: hypothetical protein LBF86_03795 [Helicobacteraceae bacterium]|jgi:hypothetical protein|nr:hypothetical protein [Helicobacteraceae bacterium]
MKTLAQTLRDGKKAYIILFIISCSISVIIHYFGFFFIQLCFYLKNGNLIDLKYYYVELPFPKWVISGNDNFGYAVSAKNDFSYAISTAENESIDIAISRRVGQPNDPDSEMVSTILRWKALAITFVSYKEVEGTKYLYKGLEGKYVMLFLSDDRRFYLIVTSYDPTEENEKYLDLLLNSVKKKPDV